MALELMDSELYCPIYEKFKFDEKPVFEPRKSENGNEIILIL